jgi:glycosyltransferase involved in cell wall biosynthesis
MNSKRPIGCPLLTVIICAKNEAANLPYVIPKIPQWVDEILLVDGNSDDHTVELAKKLCPTLQVLLQPKSGKGDALKYGVKNARGELIVTLDADGSTDPDDLLRFVQPLLVGFDFTKGSRFLGNHLRMPVYRRFGNWVLVMTTNLLFRTKYTDVCSGYNAFRKEAFSKLNLVYDGFEMEQEMNVKIKKTGLNVIEVACIDNGRQAGFSKVINVKQGFKDFMVIIKERFSE